MSRVVKRVKISKKKCKKNQKKYKKGLTVVKTYGRITVSKLEGSMLLNVW